MSADRHPHNTIRQTIHHDVLGETTNLDIVGKFAALFAELQKENPVLPQDRPAVAFRKFPRFRVALGKTPAHEFPDMRTPASNHHRESGQGGRWFLAALGLALALIGGIFVWLMGRSFLRAREMRSWPEVGCVILASEVLERIHDPQSPPEYRHSVSFGYEWQGAAQTGDHLTLRGSPWSSKRELAEQRAAEYPAGTTTSCRVNPRNPDFAVLKPDSLAPGYSIWFPGLFVVGGLGIAVRAMVSNRNGNRRGGAC